MQTGSKIQSTARTCLSLGLSVLPVRADGSKAPSVFWECLQYERMSLENVAKVFKPHHGLALIGGQVSGNLEILDFDRHDLFSHYEAAARAAGLGDLLDRLKNGYCEHSPNGEHLLYRCSVIQSNQKLANTYDRHPDGSVKADKKGTLLLKALIETRGEGGYCIIAPSNGRVHESGKPYTLLSGSLETIPTITPEEREDLFALARTFDEVKKKDEDPPGKRTARPSAGDRPGDLFNARATWEDVLAPHG